MPRVHCRVNSGSMRSVKAAANVSLRLMKPVAAEGPGIMFKP